MCSLHFCLTFLLVIILSLSVIFAFSVTKDGTVFLFTPAIIVGFFQNHHRATLQGEATKRSELGIDTVVVSSYGMCSKTCEPWQGKVYIDDVFCEFKGEINGETGKSGYCKKWFTLLSVAVKNGLFHPNCRHGLSTYIDGITQIPPPIDEQVIKKQRELEQRQRAMERKIRRLKRLVAATSDEGRLKAYKSQLRLAQKELKAFVDDHSDILRRDSIRGLPRHSTSQGLASPTHHLKGI